MNAINSLEPKEMENIKILIIGKHEWIEHLSSNLDEMKEPFVIERIEDEDKALERLTHNSYDVLLLQDKFSKVNPIKLASLAYAMTRPSIIVCSSYFKYISFKFWHHLSKFSRKFKTSRKLINFNLKCEDLEKMILNLSSGYMNYFDDVNKEIKKHTL